MIYLLIPTIIYLALGCWVVYELKNAKEEDED